MASPPIIDVSELLNPISQENGDNPAGHPMDYGVEQQLVEARKDYEQGPEGRVARTPDWDTIIKVASEQLKTKSKDLALATRLTEALVRRHGAAGLRDGLNLIRRLSEECWDRLYPISEEGVADDDEEDGLAARRSRLLGDALSDPDAGFSFPHTVRQMPLVVVDGHGYSVQDKHQADRDRGPISKDEFTHAQPFGDNTMEDLKEARQEFEQLDKVLQSKLEKNSPNLEKLDEAIGECVMFLDHYAPQPEEEPEAAGEEAAAAAATEKLTAAGSASAVSTREEAYKQLAKIAAVLEKIEPHSPIPDMLRWAVELGKMPFRKMLREMVEDDKLLGQVYRLVGKKDISDEE